MAVDEFLHSPCTSDGPYSCENSETNEEDQMGDSLRIGRASSVAHPETAEIPDSTSQVPEVLLRPEPNYVQLEFPKKPPRNFKKIPPADGENVR